MREHDRARELLGLYALEELSPEEESELREHLNGCPACREEMEVLRKARSRLRGAFVAPPPELKQRVMDRLPRRAKRRSTFLVAAALLLVFISGGTFFAGLIAPAEYATSSLGPTALAPGAGGEARLRESGANVQVSLEVWGLPNQRSDEFYEVWFVRGEERVSAGSFTVGPEGRAKINASVPAELAKEYPAVGITAEEAPGDPRPSGEKVLGGELTRS
jgi:hypothetical protein